MKVFGRIGLVATLAFGTGTLAEESISTGAEIREVIALAGADHASADAAPTASLDELAGRYDGPQGAVYVSREGDVLVLEISDSAPPTALVQLDARTFASAGDTVIVSFSTDASGRVSGLVLSTMSTDSTLSAARAAPRRGIVTIQDVREEVVRL